MTRAPFLTSSVNRTSEPLEIVHSDLCGPMQVEFKSGAKYFVTFIGDHSRWCEVWFLRNKSDVFNAFKEYKVMVENSGGKRVKLLQSDNGKEYLNKQFEDFLKENGIQRRLTIAYNPEQNGTAEKKTGFFWIWLAAYSFTLGSPLRFGLKPCPRPTTSEMSMSHQGSPWSNSLRTMDWKGS